MFWRLPKPLNIKHLKLFFLNLAFHTKAFYRDVHIHFGYGLYFLIFLLYIIYRNYNIITFILFQVFCLSANLVSRTDTSFSSFLPELRKISLKNHFICEIFLNACKDLFGNKTQPINLMNSSVGKYEKCQIVKLLCKWWNKNPRMAI